MCSEACASGAGWFCLGSRFAASPHEPSPRCSCARLKSRGSAPSNRVMRAMSAAVAAAAASPATTPHTREIATARRDTNRSPGWKLWLPAPRYGPDCATGGSSSGSVMEVRQAMNESLNSVEPGTRLYRAGSEMSQGSVGREGRRPRSTCSTPVGRLLGRIRSVSRVTADKTAAAPTLDAIEARSAFTESWNCTMRVRTCSKKQTYACWCGTRSCIWPPHATKGKAIAMLRKCSNPSGLRHLSELGVSFGAN
mmetsp:Transcript_584/g.1757  ORF Transcript_584/g.1757 Transcript_584/m.1757 type:complete len:252 (-) Transcript_584:196-951(-)